MKIKFIVFTFLLIVSILNAQIGKPKYLVKAERADTTLGNFTIELFPTIAPLHAAYFDSLVNISFYDSLAFHRVIPDFVVQGGDPNSKNGPRETWGEGDPSQKNIPAEFSAAGHLRGTIGAARDEDINSANSQFYVNVVDNNGLNGQYTVYGQVTEGMEVVDFIVDVPRDANDNPLEKIIMFITKLDTNYNIVNVPQNLKPENGEEASGPSMQIEWDASLDAIYYSVQIASDSLFTNIIKEFDTRGTKTIVNDLEAGQYKYYWRVKANNGGHVSEFSEVKYFFSSVTAPNPLSPENGSSDISLPVNLIWNKVNGAISYRLQLGTKPTFSSGINVDSSGIADTSFIYADLEGDTKYYWKIQSETATYQGPKSLVWSFTTENTTDIKDPITGPESYKLLQNYPNPFNPTTTFKFDLPEKSFVKFLIYDIKGEIVSTLINKQLSKGSYIIPFSAGNLSSGVYFYSLITEKYTSYKKMLLIK